MGNSGRNSDCFGVASTIGNGVELKTVFFHGCYRFQAVYDSIAKAVIRTGSTPVSGRIAYQCFQKRRSGIGIGVQLPVALNQLGHYTGYTRSSHGGSRHGHVGIVWCGRQNASAQCRNFRLQAAILHWSGAAGTTDGFVYLRISDHQGIFCGFSGGSPPAPAASDSLRIP